MKIVAVIPARGGSKGIPAKNIKKFCGKPLIVWTIESALKSKVDRVIVSTDNEEIKKIALKYGAEVPFIRPKELAIDSIGIEPTLIHTYEWLKNNENYGTDAIVLLMPTSPTRQYFHINEALEIFKKTKADSVVAVNETPAKNTLIQLK
jgi:CMP-N-acetylneuraminic acid synthetase